jgi:hypothetical protein
MWGFDKTRHDEQNQFVGCILLPEADPMKGADSMSTAPATPPEKKHPNANERSSQANRVLGGRAELHECGTGRAMLAALAVYPVIVHFGLRPSALRQSFDVRFR